MPHRDHNVVTYCPRTYLAGRVETRYDAARIRAARLVRPRRPQVVRIAAHATVAGILLPLHCTFQPTNKHKKKTESHNYQTRPQIAVRLSRVRQALTGVAAAEQLVVVVVDRIREAEAPHGVARGRIHQATVATDRRDLRSDVGGGRDV